MEFPMLVLAPSHCPECSTSLQMEGEYLVCPNSVGCSAQVLGAIRSWVAKTGVKHLGDEMIDALYNAGVVRGIPDLYRIDPRVASGVHMSGRMIGGGIDRAIASLGENLELPLNVIVGSLGINGVGRSMVKLLTDAGWDLNQMAFATVGDIASIPGFGIERARAFREGFDARVPLIQEILAAGVKIKMDKPEVTGSSLVGVAVCMTGFRDAQMELEIQANGGLVKSGVAKGLTYLVTKDPSSTSGKAQKARELGVKIVGVQEMWNIIKGV
jgi:DNA ligase (NAD+)